MFTTNEMKVLKYIKRHENTTKKELCEKFNFFEDVYNQICCYAPYSGDQPVIDKNGNETGEYVWNDSSTFSLNRQGIEFFQKRRNEAWVRWFPYAITTLIALSSIIIQVIRLYLDYFSCK